MIIDREDLNNLKNIFDKYNINLDQSVSAVLKELSMKVKENENE